MARAIRVFMARHFGFTTRVLSIERRKVLSSSRQRTFHTVTLLSGLSRRRQLHVRLTRWEHRQRDDNRLDAYLSAQGLPVPEFFGSVENDGLVATIWEHCPGASHKRYNRMSAPHRRETIKAMAMISAHSSDVRDHAEVPNGPRWVHPVAGDIDQIASLWGDLGPHRRDIDYLAAHEDEIIQRFHQAGPQILNHNDLMARNVIAMDNGDVRILDWDSATIGPAGASLRGFVYSMKGGAARDAAELYASEMGRYGISLKSDEILYVMRAQQVFWYLSSGLQRKNFRRVVKGLEFFQSTFTGL